MNCCKCKCSFAKCVEEHKEDLNKELNKIITNWMKSHPEVKKVWIGDKSCCFSNSVFIHQDIELDVSVYFE